MDSSSDEECVITSVARHRKNRKSYSDIVASHVQQVTELFGPKAVIGLWDGRTYIEGAVPLSAPPTQVRVRATPPPPPSHQVNLNQLEGSFSIVLPKYALSRACQDVPFMASEIIQKMATETLGLKTYKGCANVKFIIYLALDLRKGTFSQGWKAFLSLNELKGDERLKFVVPRQDGPKLEMFVFIHKNK